MYTFCACKLNEKRSGALRIENPPSPLTKHKQGQAPLRVVVFFQQNIIIITE
jgi:hypothetical protein